MGSLKVRVGDGNDFSTLVSMALHFLAQSPHREYELSLSKISDFITPFVSGTTDKRAFILNDKFQSVGCLLAGIVEWPFSFQKYAFEFMWWVRPEYRGHGGLLLREYQIWAREVGVSHSVLSSMATSDKRLASLYARKGYTPLETLYIKDNV